MTNNFAFVDSTRLLEYSFHGFKCLVRVLLRVGMQLSFGAPIQVSRLHRKSADLACKCRLRMRERALVRGSKGLLYLNNVSGNAATINRQRHSTYLDTWKCFECAWAACVEVGTMSVHSRGEFVRALDRVTIVVTTSESSPAQPNGCPDAAARAPNF